MTDSETPVPAPSTGGFVHLHVHTEHSKQDSIARVTALAQNAAADGQVAIAMTDHGNTGGAYKFVQACKKAGVKPILGIEAYMALTPEADWEPVNDADAAAKDAGVPLAMRPGVRFQKATRHGMDAESGKAKRVTNNHITILARNEAGWRNLCAITNKAEDSVYYKSLIDYALIKEHGEGLIVLTGCLGGPVASHVAAARRALRILAEDAPEQDVAGAQVEFDAQMDQARTNLGHLIDCVGAENVYVEIMEHGLEAEGIEHIKLLSGLADEFNLRVVATNDSHYIDACDEDAHDSWLVNGENARGNKTEKNDPDRWRFNGEGYWMRTAEEMRAIYPKARTWQRACDETLRIAERVEENVIPDKGLRIPKFPVPADVIAEWEAGTEATVADINGVEHPARKVGRRAYRTPSALYLHQLVRQGAAERYGGVNSPEAKALGLASRLNFEFDVITGMGLEDYFLIVWDVLAWARSDRGLATPEHPEGVPGQKKPILVGPGRGSAAGSAISYCLWIVMVEPLANDLLFERFLDVARIGMPDIDVDFEAARRDEVYDYLVSRYGAEYIARIGAFQVAKTKRAIKDAARVLSNTPLGEKLAKAVPVHQGSPQGFPVIFEEVIDKETGRPKPNPEAQEFRDMVAGDPAAAEIVALARSFENVIAGEGIHSAGVIISDEPLTDLIPMRRLRDKKGQIVGVPVALWDGRDIDDFGMLKLDALGLRNLDVVSAAVSHIEHVTGEVIDPDLLPDPDTEGDERVSNSFALLREGRTSGIFQLESSGMTELCEQIAPTEFGDLSALVALYRPGPMGAGMHTRYADRKNGREAVDYRIYTSDEAETAVIESVLGDTFGTCVAEGERVYSATRGLMVPIEDIQIGELVQGVDEAGRHVLAPVTDHIDNGVRDTVLVRFSGGRNIRVTADHRILTTKGWKPAGDLTEADSVAAPWELLGTGDTPGLLDSQWLRVLDVTPQEPVQVYDLTVDGIHNFVAEGVVVHNCAYQEQMMVLAEVVAGFSADQKNRLRKAFSKKDRPAMEALQEVFLTQGQSEMTLDDGTHKIAFAKNTLLELWRTFDASAEYLFNKSHSAAYGYLAYVTAYLKANWPTEYGAGILGVTDKADKRLLALFALAQEGIEVLPPDVNLSRAKTSPDPHNPSAVRLGLTEIRDVGNNGRWIEVERDRGGAFTDMRDLMTRVKVPGPDGSLTAKLSVTAVEGLIEAGAFDSLGLNRMGLMIALRAATADVDLGGVQAEWSPLEASTRQRIRIGVALGNHPLTAYRDTLRDYVFNERTDRWGNIIGGRPAPLHRVAEMPKGNTITLGVLTSWTERTTRNGAKMANFTIEGTKAAMSGTMFSDAMRELTRSGSMPQIGDIVGLAGQVKTRTITTVEVDPETGEEVEESRDVRELIGSFMEVVEVDTVPRIDLPEVADDDRVNLFSAISKARGRLAEMVEEKKARQAEARAAKKAATKPKKVEPKIEDDSEEFDFDTAEAQSTLFAEPREIEESDDPQVALAAPSRDPSRPWIGYIAVRKDTSFAFPQNPIIVDGRVAPRELRARVRAAFPVGKGPMSTKNGEGKVFRLAGGCFDCCKRCCGDVVDVDPCEHHMLDGGGRPCDCTQDCSGDSRYRGQYLLMMGLADPDDAPAYFDQIVLESPAWEPVEGAPRWSWAPLSAFAPALV